MKIKKYVAKSMKEALIQIKQELGEDAIILKTSKAPRKKFSLGAGDEIEVTAAIDDAPTRQAFEALRVPDTGVYSRPKPARPTAVSSMEAEDVGPQRASLQSELLAATGALDTPTNVVDLKEDIRQIKELLKPIVQTTPAGPVQTGGFDGHWAVLYDKLVSLDVRTDIASEIITRINGETGLSSAQAGKRFFEELSAAFTVSGPLKTKQKGPFVCAFVGPTGAGKTTTLAKLAAHYKLNKNKSVAIITADTYRIAAIEQIRTFAEIMNIRLHVVFSPEEASGAKTQCAGDDIVFVDTAGRSPKNAEHMRDARALLEAIKPDETHVVLSAGAKDADCISQVERYRGFGANRVLFTKLDETMKLGSIFNTVVRTKMPVSYFTFGQSVPDDIELAQPTRFLQRLWKEDRT